MTSNIILSDYSRSSACFRARRVYNIVKISNKIKTGKSPKDENQKQKAKTAPPTQKENLICSRAIVPTISQRHPKMARNILNAIFASIVTRQDRLFIITMYPNIQRGINVLNARNVLVGLLH